jgi:hypothetical protein
MLKLDYDIYIKLLNYIHPKHLYKLSKLSKFYLKYWKLCSSKILFVTIHNGESVGICSTYGETKKLVDKEIEKIRDNCGETYYGWVTSIKNIEEEFSHQDLDDEFAKKKYLRFNYVIKTITVEYTKLVWKNLSTTEDEFTICWWLDI